MKKRYRIFWLREPVLGIVVRSYIIRVWQKGEPKPIGLFITDDGDERNFQEI